MLEDFPPDERGLILFAVSKASELIINDDLAEQLFTLYDKLRGKHEVYELRRQRRQTQERIYG